MTVKNDAFQNGECLNESRTDLEKLSVAGHNLVLDLDHTLISSFEFGESPLPKAAGVNTVSPILTAEYSDDLGLPEMYHASISNVVVLIKLRPFVRSFIKSAAKSGMTIHVYTKGRRSYMEEVLRILDPDEVVRGRRVSRDDEPPQMKDSQKDISLIKEVLETRYCPTIVLDDSPGVWSSCVLGSIIEVIAAQRYSFSDMFVEFLRYTERGITLRTTSQGAAKFPTDDDVYLRHLFETCVSKLVLRKRVTVASSPALSSFAGQDEPESFREKDEAYTHSSDLIGESKTLSVRHTTHITRTSSSKVKAFINVNRRSIF